MNNCYVYRHINPKTKETIYIGMGTKDRAWQYQNRSKEHRKILDDIFSNGYFMDDVVKLISKNLTTEKARKLEIKLIDQHRCKLNRADASWCLVFKEDQIQEIIKLRLLGKSYSQIAKIMNSSTMTVYRAYNNKTKGYKNYNAK